MFMNYIYIMHYIEIWNQRPYDHQIMPLPWSDCPFTYSDMIFYEKCGLIYTAWLFTWL